MSLVNALNIAVEAHDGMRDKGGHPFIGHPLRVMATLSGQGFDEPVLEAAILHDVLEDTILTALDLRELGISDRVIDIVVALTRPAQRPYAEYIRTIREFGYPAVNIKLADLADNMDPARAVEGTDKLMDRYRKAVEVLEGF